MRFQANQIRVVPSGSGRPCEKIPIGQLGAGEIGFVRLFLLLIRILMTCTDIPLILPEGDVLEFGEKHIGKGLASGEEELPEDKPGTHISSSVSLY